LHVTKVVFPNGSTDPWHVLGITSDLSPSATAIYIKGNFRQINIYICCLMVVDSVGWLDDVTGTYSVEVLPQQFSNVSEDRPKLK